MAVPKKRHTRGRRRKKDANKSLQIASIRACPQCGESKRPHRVCTTCGHYRSKEVLEVLD